MTVQRARGRVDASGRPRADAWRVACPARRVGAESLAGYASPVPVPPSVVLWESQLATLALHGEERVAAVGEVL
jgi:hypothetical protein